MKQLQSVLSLNQRWLMLLIVLLSASHAFCDYLYCSRCGDYGVVSCRNVGPSPLRSIGRGQHSFIGSVPRFNDNQLAIFNLVYGQYGDDHRPADEFYRALVRTDPRLATHVETVPLKTSIWYVYPYSELVNPGLQWDHAGQVVRDHRVRQCEGRIVYADGGTPVEVNKFLLTSEKPTQPLVHLQVGNGLDWAFEHVHWTPATVRTPRSQFWSCIGPSERNSDHCRKLRVEHDPMVPGHVYLVFAASPENLNEQTEYIRVALNQPVVKVTFTASAGTKLNQRLNAVFNQPFHDRQGMWQRGTYTLWLMKDLDTVTVEVKEFEVGNHRDYVAMPSKSAVPKSSHSTIVADPEELHAMATGHQQAPDEPAPPEQAPPEQAPPDEPAPPVPALNADHRQLRGNHATEGRRGPQIPGVAPVRMKPKRARQEQDRL